MTHKEWLISACKRSGITPSNAQVDNFMFWIGAPRPEYADAARVEGYKIVFKRAPK